MTNKKKMVPKAVMPKGHGVDNSASEMTKKKASVASSVQFRHEVLESQKRINYQSVFDRLQGFKR